jgi:hypothetical protein
MIRRPSKFLAAWTVVTVAFATVALAQTDDRARLLDEQIDRIYRANAYALPRFGPARWLADGTAYTTVERSDVRRRVDCSLRCDDRRPACSSRARN